MPDDTQRNYDVEDHAWRLFRHGGGDVGKLPGHFVTALEISARDHMRMVAAIGPFVDSAISKTVNVAESYPYGEFEDLYLEAWKSGLKGITTYRPNAVLGSVLSVAPTAATAEPNDLDTSDTDRRIRLEAAPAPALMSLRWPGRPTLPDGSCGVSQTAVRFLRCPTARPANPVPSNSRVRGSGVGATQAAPTTGRASTISSSRSRTFSSCRASCRASAT